MAMARNTIVTADGLRLRVTEQGGADAGAELPTVLLVHGYPDNSGVWDGVAEVLARRYRVVRYDVRGCGGSEAPADRAGYRLDRLAADVAAVARAVSPGAGVHLVGHDWGSIQGWQAVTEPRYADLFASYTSISGPCLDHVAPWMRDQFARRRPQPALRQLLHSWYIGFFQLPVLPELVWRLPWSLARFGAAPRDARNGIELYRANMLSRRDTRDARRTSVPVLQIVLTRDTFVTPELLVSAQPWCDRLWRSELPFGHWAPRTHPTTIADVVAEFVDHVRTGSEGGMLSATRVV